ncbi:preprotein translocase subunit SecA [Azohydromonas lata]|uniref:Preprotein translocase subunit SecA n=2 Tax=Azohydromonas lata TaxID=45677 RepID=A0ABU5ID12_9BURK|nr:preprotein translocase subunit SecA [Azohydromonas lata]MDZ5456699.1 preprotein translocase subunit SecA [Azohydromonas lata]
MSTTTSAAQADFRWSPPCSDKQPTGARWRDWLRWGEQRVGGFQRRLQRDAAEVLALQQAWADMDDAALDARLAQQRSAFRLDQLRGDAARRLRIEALAAISLAAQRTLQRLPYRVQLLAALAMHEGLLVQMNAGEGKTLTVALVGVLRGWRGLPCHVITSNDYLAKRDVELMDPLYRRCGVSAAAAVHGLSPQQLRDVYAADLVYATSKQLLADHLFDQIALDGASDAMRRRLRELRPQQGCVRQRGLYSAIVDEADSVLIDEANTPLIISAPQPNELLMEAVLAARDVAEELEAERDYRLDAQLREIDFTSQGRERLEAATRRLPAVWHAPQRRDDLIRQALSARDLFLRDRHYIVQDGKVQILDENTGRVMPGRTWSFGLHQAIEAREGVQISQPSKTLARMSFQEFFSLYHHLAGASGTLQGVRSEMWWTYGLLTFVVPTRLPSRLRVPPLRHFADAQAKWTAVLECVEQLHRRGMPVLVGTRRLGDSEMLQQRLAERGLACEVLNAKQHEREADIIALAGEPGRITVATNMAGRGTDILLGAGVAEQGGLQVLMVEPHESERVDWQLFGRAGRQGQPGFAQAFVGLEDDLLQRHLPFWLVPLRDLLARSPRWRGALAHVLVRWAQRRAQRQAFQQRRYLRLREQQLRKQLAFASDGAG